MDTGFRDGSAVSPHYDAMLAKVIAHGRTRADAARRLARALQTAQIHGLTTNRDLLVAILREPELPGRRHRHRLPDPPRPRRPGRIRSRVFHRAVRPGRGAGPPGGQPRRGFRPGYPALGLAQRRLRAAAGQLHRRGGAVRRGLPRPRRHRPGLGQRRAAGPGHAHRYTASPDRVDLEIDGIRRVYRVHRVGPKTPARTSTPATGPAP